MWNSASCSFRLHRLNRRGLVSSTWSGCESNLQRLASSSSITLGVLYAVVVLYTHDIAFDIFRLHEDVAHVVQLVYLEANQLHPLQALVC